MKKLLLLLPLLLCGCELRDPSKTGSAPSCPGTKWTLCSPVVPTYTSCCKATLPEGNVTVDPTTMIDVALCNNPKTRQAWSMARSAAYSWRASKSDYYPQVAYEQFLDVSDRTLVGGNAANASTAANVQDAAAGGADIVIGQGYNQTNTYNLSISYLVLDFGGRSATTEVARQALLAANWTNNRTIQTVVLNVLSAYYQHLAAKSNYEASLKDLEDAKTSYTAAEKLYEVGLQNIVDVLQTKTQFIQAQRAVEVALGDVTNTMGQLASNLGLPADTYFPVDPLPDNLPVSSVKENVEELMVKARKDRPDFAAAFANLEQKRAVVSQALSLGLPTITANVDLEQVNNIHFPSQNGHIYSGFVSLDVPLFSGFLDLNTLRQTQADVTTADAALRDKELEVYLDVWTSYTTLQTSIETIKYTEELLIYTRKAFDGALLNYKEGTGTILDVLSTQASLANARSEWIDSRTQWVTALASLAYAVGSL